MCGHVTPMESKRIVRRLFIMKQVGFYLEDASVDWMVNIKIYLKEI